MWFGFTNKEPQFYEGKLLDCYLPENQIPTPTDDTCRLCGEMFVEGDEGIRFNRPDGYVNWHIACLNAVFDAAPS